MRGPQIAHRRRAARPVGMRMTERHYVHLSPSYVADAIRAALPSFGGDEKSNVAGLNAGR
jgi:hypothetical protein